MSTAKRPNFTNQSPVKKQGNELTY